jgi:xanthine dehydrogenase accessory factor
VQKELIVLIKGAGEQASGVAYRLSCCHFKVVMTELPSPLAERREVTFCEAVYEGQKEVEGLVAELVHTTADIHRVWHDRRLPILTCDADRIEQYLRPHVVIDGTMVKRNTGTRITEAPLVIGLGVGFEAGVDVHVVVETNRGQNLGRVIYKGRAEANTGIPDDICGLTIERVFHAPKTGRFFARKKIGDYIEAGEVVACVDEIPITSKISGVVRGILRDGIEVRKGVKAGDIDPRSIKEYCFTISDKPRAIAGGVLEAILHRFGG